MTPPDYNHLFRNSRIKNNFDMKIAIIGGTGYVGLCTGLGFAVKGHHVICVGRNKEKIEKLKSGKSIIYEPLVGTYLATVLEKKNFEPTTDMDYAIKNSDVIFISVGTPSKADGSIDTGDIEAVSMEIGRLMASRDSYFVVVVKSTVVPETTEKVVIPELEKLSSKKAGEGFGVCMNPEFLREGKALDDFLNPDRIVIGELDKKSGDIVQDLYKNFDSPIIRTNLKTAEMIKYASNAFLATKISFANEVGNICKILGIDSYEVMNGVGLDKRIGRHFLDSGIGWGGSCFPKDIAAIIAKAKEMAYNPEILDTITKTNDQQPLKLVEILQGRLHYLRGKRIAVLGLAFKADTDDIRDTKSAPVIEKLLELGAEVVAYDPKAIQNFRVMFPKINYAESCKAALEGADACLILTDWQEFRKLENNDFDLMKNRVIVEGRRVLDKKNVSGFEGICW